MKRILMAATALAVAMTGTIASAQDGYRGRDDHGSYGRDHRDDRRDGQWNRGDDSGRGQWNGRGDRDGYDRHDDRGNRNRYARGQRYRGDGAYLSDYGRYGYRAPPRGYRYYRTNEGDVVLAAVATGIIASVIAGNSRY